MLHACVARFDVIGNLEKFLVFVWNSYLDCPLSLPHRSCGKPKIQRVFCSPEIWHRLLLKAEGKSVVCQTYGELRKLSKHKAKLLQQPVVSCGIFFLSDLCGA